MAVQEDLIRGMVAEFIIKFEASLDPRVWASLISEEKKELEEAIIEGNKSHILKEACDLFYVQVGFNLVSAGADQIGLFSEREQGELMALVSSSQEVYEAALDALSGANLFEAFRRVHLSNMSKMGEDGLPLKNEAGKILKGPNYVEPKLGDLV